VRQEDENVPLSKAGIEPDSDEPDDIDIRQIITASKPDPSKNTNENSMKTGDDS